MPETRETAMNLSPAEIKRKITKKEKPLIRLTRGARTVAHKYRKVACYDVAMAGIEEGEDAITNSDLSSLPDYEGGSTEDAEDDEDASECDLPPAYDSVPPTPEEDASPADVLLATEYKPIPDLELFLESLHRPQDRTTKALYDVCANAQSALKQWQDEYMAIDARLQRTDPDYKPKNNPRQLDHPTVHESKKEAMLYGYHYKGQLRENFNGGLNYEDDNYQTWMTKKSGPSRHLRARAPEQPAKDTHPPEIEPSSEGAAEGRSRRTRKARKLFDEDLETGTSRATSSSAVKRKRGMTEDATDEHTPDPSPRKRSRRTALVRNPLPPSRLGRNMRKASSLPSSTEDIETVSDEEEQEEEGASDNDTATPTPAGNSKATTTTTTTKTKTKTITPATKPRKGRTTKTEVSKTPKAAAVDPTTESSNSSSSTAADPTATSARTAAAAAGNTMTSNQTSATTKTKIGRPRVNPRKAPKTVVKDAEGKNPTRRKAMAEVWARRKANGTSGRHGGAPLPKWKAPGTGRGRGRGRGRGQGQA